LEKRSATYHGKRKSSNSSDVHLLYLPFESQHRLLVTVQELLEQACFEFGQQSLESILEMKGWICARQVELSTWTSLFKQHKDKFDHSKCDLRRDSLSTFMSSIAQIRHNAVHRTLLAANQIEQLMRDAVLFAQLLGNEHCQTSVLELEGETKAIIRCLKVASDRLRVKNTLKREKINGLKVKLDRYEEELAESQSKELKHYISIAGLDLESTLHKMSALKASSKRPMVGQS
jgi:hypothetical protein